jgi:rhomboid protease GluP
MRGTGIRPQWSATIAILVVNVIVYGIDHYLIPAFFPKFPFDAYFELSIPGLKAGFFWQLLTYQLMHANFLHILLNCWAIYVFGRAVESYLGKGRMLGLYFASGIGGGILQMLGGLVWPEHFGTAAVGASAGAFGLITAFAVLFPQQLLVLLLFFVIPIRMKAKTMLWLSIAMAVFGIIVPYGNIGHAAHLGGIITGYVFARWFLRRSYAPPTNQFY